MTVSGQLQVTLDREAVLVVDGSRLRLDLGELMDRLFENVPASEMGPLVYREDARVTGRVSDDMLADVSEVVIRRAGVEFRLFLP